MFTSSIQRIGPSSFRSVFDQRILVVLQMVQECPSTVYQRLYGQTDSPSPPSHNPHFWRLGQYQADSPGPGLSYALVLLTPTCQHAFPLGPVIISLSLQSHTTHIICRFPKNAGDVPDPGSRINWRQLGQCPTDSDIES